MQTVFVDTRLLTPLPPEVDLGADPILVGKSETKHVLPHHPDRKPMEDPETDEKRSRAHGNPHRPMPRSNRDTRDRQVACERNVVTIHQNGRRIVGAKSERCRTATCAMKHVILLKLAQNYFNMYHLSNKPTGPCPDRVARRCAPASQTLVRD